MESKKSMFAGSLIASAILGLSNLGANASTLTTYSALGSGAEVRNELLNTTSSNLNGFELKCGADSTKAHGKGKDGKCGEGHKKDAKGGTADHKKDAAKPADQKKDATTPK